MRPSTEDTGGRNIPEKGEISVSYCRSGRVATHPCLFDHKREQAAWYARVYD